MKVGQIEQGCFLPSSLQVWISSLVDTKNESYILCFLTSHQLGGSWRNLAYSADKGSKIYQCCQETSSRNSFFTFCCYSLFTKSFSFLLFMMQPLSSCALPLLLFSCLLPLHFLAKAQAQVHVFCNNPTNYTSGSVFQRNLNLVLSSFAASASISDFNMTTVGQDPDTVYGLIQCRSDVSKE